MVLPAVFLIFPSSRVYVQTCNICTVCTSPPRQIVNCKSWPVQIHFDWLIGHQRWSACFLSVRLTEELILFGKWLTYWAYISIPLQFFSQPIVWVFVWDSVFVFLHESWALATLWARLGGFLSPEIDSRGWKKEGPRHSAQVVCVHTRQRGVGENSIVLRGRQMYLHGH